MRYPKIETLWNRDKDTFKVIPWYFRRPEFELVNKWYATEKVDGMNWRVKVDAGWNVTFGGRTDKANLPADLVGKLTPIFTQQAMMSVFDVVDEGVVLFGEGYGPGIQKGGGGYRKDKDFILFDVRVGEWWLEWNTVKDIANQLGILTVPYLGEITELPTTKEDLEAIIPRSVVAFSYGMPDKQAEGIVCKTSPQLFDRYGNRVMWKLKFRDFEEGKR